jgi:NAD(P)H-hydrate epimerase
MMVLTAQQAATVDAVTIEQIGIPGLVLMENAGRSVVRFLEQNFASALAAGVSVVCGRGNNGGDGFVCARVLHQHGIDVEVLLLGSHARLKGDAAHNHELLSSAVDGAVTVHEIAAEADVARLLEARRPGVILDAIFGTGLDRPPTGLSAAGIEAINAQACPVVAIDIPSGVNGTSGEVMGTAVRATHTVTVGFLKRGLLLYPGAAHAGRITVAEIGFPQRLAREGTDAVELITPRQVSQWLPRREATANKGSVGKLLIVAGSAGMSGAAMLATTSAQRSGIGLARTAALRTLLPVFESVLIEAVKVPVPDDDRFTEKSIETLRREADEADALAVGPGVGRHDDTQSALKKFLSQQTKPMVVDADGLRALESAARAAERVIITPHPGEASHLLGRPTTEVVRDPLGAARELAQKFQVVALLKGAHTVVADASGRAWINVTGNAAMASGGVGDVLTGVVGTLLAEGVEPLAAAACAAYVHGLAGDLAARDIGEAGVVAGDIVQRLPTAFTLARQAAPLDCVPAVI